MCEAALGSGTQTHLIFIHPLGLPQLRTQLGNSGLQVTELPHVHGVLVPRLFSEVSEGQKSRQQIKTLHGLKGPHISHTLPAMTLYGVTEQRPFFHCANLFLQSYSSGLRTKLIDIS